MSAPPTAPAHPPRLATLDTLRGLIMALMALDHASAFIAHRHSVEFWGGEITRYDGALPFLARFVTHLCAPGFFFLMGCGMALWSDARRRHGWSHWRIAGFYLKRGLLLVAINQFIENPAWLIGYVFQAAGGDPQPPVPGGGIGPFLITGVLTALGLSLAVGGLLLRFGSSVWLALAVAGLWMTSAWMPPAEQAATLFHPIVRLLLIPGHTHVLLVMYPLIPWFALTALGVVFARRLEHGGPAAFRLAAGIGLVMVIAGLVLRATGGFGNLRPPRDGSWIEFLNFVKYPPALVFSLFTLGVNLMILGALAFQSRFAAALAPLAVFGRTPLFFYLAHLYFYAVLGALFFRRPVEMPWMMAVWGAGLVPLWHLCRHYRAFKEGRPAGSFWRFL